VPETVRREYGLENAQRVRDTPIHGLGGDVGRYTKLSECWHGVQWTGRGQGSYSLREERVKRAAWAGLLGAGHSLVLRF
jgi:hypothetical protein